MRSVAIAVLLAGMTFAAASQNELTFAPQQVPAKSDVSGADLERIAAAIERALPTHRRLECLVTSRIWQSKKGEPAPNPHRDPPGLQLEFLVRLLGPGHAVVAERPLRSMNLIFDGFTYQATFEESAAMVHEGTRDPSLGGLALLLQTDFFAPVELEGSLSAAVRGASPLSLTITDNVAVLRFNDKSDEKSIAAYIERSAKEGKPLEGPKPKPWPREITVDLSDPPRLLGWAIDIPQNGLDKPSTRNEWIVEEWQDVDGMRLPRRIQRTMEMHDGSPYVQVSELSRVTRLPEPAIEPGEVIHPLPEGLRVNEPQGYLVFTVGSPSVIFETRTLRLREPLWVHPGKRLEEVIRSATPE